MEGTSMELLGVKKGQGATEYLVLLAVVLIVAMVAIALLGFFPGLAIDAKKTQSDAYWRGEARPFAILEHAQTGATLSLVIQNLEAEQKQITNISVAGQGSSGSDPLTGNQYFSAGEKKRVNFNLGSNCTSGNTYEYTVNFTYSNADATITGQKEYGTKTLVGKCS